MSDIPTAFVDTVVIKFASETEVLIPRRQGIPWGGKTIELTVHSFGVRREVDLLPEGELKREAALIRPIAELARGGQLRVITQAEVVHESWTLPWVRGAQLYGVDIEWVEAPIEYSRIIGSIVPPATNERRNDMKESTVDFLLGVRDKRFEQIQVACGAKQGKAINPNQLIDAFHVWCAENAGAAFFLTLDFKLIRTVRARKRFPVRVKLVRLSELLAALQSPTSRTTGA